MRDYRYLEHMGIPYKIIQGMLAHNGTETELIVENERFILQAFRQPIDLATEQDCRR